MLTITKKKETIMKRQRKDGEYSGRLGRKGSGKIKWCN